MSSLKRIMAVKEVGLLLLITLLCDLSTGSYIRRFKPEEFARRFELESLARRQSDDAEGCGSAPADIGIIMDESGSIYGPHFDLQKAFVSDVIDNFQIGPTKTRTAVMTFSDDPKKIFDFEDFGDKEAINKTVMKIKQRRGNTMTDQALDAALAEMFLGHMRSDVVTVAIVITDGKSDYPERTAASAERLKAAGISVLAVGVGKNYSREELETIASPPAKEHVFEVESFDALKYLKDELARVACQMTTTTTTTTPTTTTPPQNIEGCDGKKMLDVMFGLPEGVSIQTTNTVFDFIGSMVEDLKIGDRQSQAGLIPQTCIDIEGIRLKDSDNNPDFLRNLESRRPLISYNSYQLEFLLEVAYEFENSGRKEGAAVRTAVLVIDSDSYIPPKTLEAAADLRSLGIHLVVIGVGSNQGESERKQLAFSSLYYTGVSSYEDLGSTKEYVIKRLCDSILFGDRQGLDF